MFITLNKPQLDAEEEIKKIEDELVKEENNRKKLEQACIAEAQEKYKVNAYCPICCCEVNLDSNEPRKINGQIPHTTKIRFIPKAIAYREVVGLEIHCPHCGSNFIENEKYKTRITDTGENIIKGTILTIVCLALIIGVIALIISNKEAISHVFENMEQTTEQTTEYVAEDITPEQSEQTTDAPDPLTALANTMLKFGMPIIGIILCISSVFKITLSIARGDVREDIIPRFISMLLGLIMLMGAIYMLRTGTSLIE